MDRPCSYYKITLNALFFALLSLPSILIAQAETKPQPLDILAMKREALARQALNETKSSQLCDVSLGAKKDNAQEVARYKHAADRGEASAANTLGWIYQCGLGLKQDYSQAIALYEKAAAQGYAPADDNLGWIFQHGLGIQKDYTQAFAWYQKAADRDDPLGEDTIGSFYLLGIGIQEDHGQAFTWYQKAANQGFASSEDELGRFYFYGVAVARDQAQAFAWFQKAADKGDALAEDTMGSLYQGGDWAVRRDVDKSFLWYQKAADQGNAVGEEMVGYFFVMGQGVPKDYAQAFPWFLKAANQGSVRSEYVVGNLYLLGNGVAKDYGEAFAWYQKAAAQGYPDADDKLGLMYQHGLGIQQDNTQAIAWYLKAVTLGSDAAERDLATLNREIARAQSTPGGNAQTSTEQPITTTQCTAWEQINTQFTPPDLYRMVGQCIQSNDYPSALALFVLAGMDTRFDAPRVADNTVGDTGAALIMQTFDSIPKAAHKKFDTATDLVRTDNAVRDYLCGWVQQVGPPTYYPTYMIMHGMNAVVAGLTKKPLQEELLPVPDASGTWKTIGTNYLHCTFAETNAPQHDAQAADRYRSAIERAIADTPAPTAPGSGTHTSSPTSSTSGNGATSDRQGQTYGPLTFNSEGADFYVTQDGKFAPASVVDGTIVIHLHPQSFQIGYNGEQLNVCLAQSTFPEVSADPSGYRASCLSGPFTGAREPNSDTLLVYGGHKWSDGNTELSDATSMKATPMKGFQFAYQVNQLQFIEAHDMTLGRFKGTLYGYIVVYKQHERSNKDIMPIQLILE